MSERSSLTIFHDDQRRRWLAGAPVLVESYLRQRPALNEDPDKLLDLIYHEIVLREQLGLRPELQEYQQRFPQLAQELDLQFQVHRAIEQDGPSHGSPTLPAGPGAHRAGASCTAGTALSCSIPGFELLEELGRGGMGIVYRARQLRLNRIVALKLIRSGLHASAAERGRFQTEAEAAARLLHPGIVQIYEIGEHQGIPYVVLEFVAGESLAQHLARGRLPLSQIVAWVEALARAMEVAHQAGVIHRDLKPGNILITPGGEPKITDFGLAKLVDTGHDHTPSEAFIGTPAYMAPEQAAGRVREVGAAADVHALGVILYEMMTGVPPFGRTTILGTLEQIRLEEAAAPASHRPDLPADLVAICMKCLEKKPADRYSRAVALADDLNAYRNGDSIQARRAGLFRRWRRWLKRRVSVGVLSTLLLGVGGLAVWQLVDRSSSDHGATNPSPSGAEQSRTRFRRFIELRDEAMVQGLSATLFTEAEGESCRRQAEQTAHEAVQLVGLDLAAKLPWQPQDQLPFPERAELNASCFQLALLLINLDAGPPERVLDLLDQIRVLFPQTSTISPAFQLRRARALREQRRGEEADRAEARADTSVPASPFDALLLGEERYRRGELELARDAFQGATASPTTRVWGSFYLGFCQLRLGRPELAAALFTMCQQTRPEFIWPALMHSLTMHRLGRLDEAEQGYRAALERDPSPEARYFLHVNRAQLLIDRNRLGEAAQDLEAAITARPGDYQAYLKRSELARQRGENANGWFQQARKHGAPSAALAAASYRANDFEAAARACADTLQTTPHSFEARALHGLALVKLQRFREALPDLDHCLSVPHTNGRASSALDLYRARGLARMKLSRFQEAIEDYTEVVRAHPDAECLTHRGWAYFFADAWKMARADFDAALQLDLRYADAVPGRALALVMVGAYRQAAEEAERALRLGPSSPEMCHNIACAFALALARVDADKTAADHAQLVEHYRTRTLETVQRTLDLVPEAERRRFWLEIIRPDPALDAIRCAAEFRTLEQRYRAQKLVH